MFAIFMCYYLPPIQLACLAENPAVEKSTPPVNAISKNKLPAAKSSEKLPATIPLSAKQILDKVASTYAECKTYEDSGMSTNEYTSKDGFFDVDRTAFRTALRRGAFTLKYRFTYRISYFGGTYGKATTLWHNGLDTLVSKNGHGKYKKEESLSMGTAGLTGKSSITAHLIPALLMPKKISGQKFFKFTSLNPPREEILGEKVCYRLEGLSHGNKITTWIEQHTFLILKVIRRSNLNGELRVQTISYIPKMDEKVPERLLGKEVEGEWEFLETVAP